MSPPYLNHVIVWSKDRNESANFLADILGLPHPVVLGHFTQVETGNGVGIDFADTTEDVHSMHLAFLVTEREFDEMFGRILQGGIAHWADPQRSRPDEINRRDGGRGVYFADPDDHLWEILTRPYGSGPLQNPA